MSINERELVQLTKVCYIHTHAIYMYVQQSM